MTDGRKKNKDKICFAGYLSLADSHIAHLPRFYENQAIE